MGKNSHRGWHNLPKCWLLCCKIEPITPSLGTSLAMTDAPSLQELTQKLLDFRDARDWRQFHSLKDLILSLSLEASELLELAQWKPEDAFEQEALSDNDTQQRLREECADVLLYLLLIAERTGIDLAKAADQKIAANNVKYPIEKSRGTSAKYTQL